MRMMVFGDTAGGKSTFATAAGAKLGIPVIHLDQIMDRVGRHDWASIGEIIRQEADRDEWIIEGNAFTKDKDYRISRADLVVVFDAWPTVTLSRHVSRYLKLKTGRETRIGSADTRLNLGYFLPYFFVHFPPRKRAAQVKARSLGKQVVIIRSRRDANRYLMELST